MTVIYYRGNESQYRARERMMDVIDQANGSELPPVLQTSSKRLPWVVGFVAIFIGLCVGGPFYRPHIDRMIEALVAHEVVPMPALSPEDKAALSEIRSGQQQVSEEISALNRNIDAQQADLKRMLDQIAALTSRIESLQNIAAHLPADIRPPVAQAASKPATRATRPPKAEGPVSVGGAPLGSRAGDGPPMIQ
ncbi:putative coiled-coil protein SlyX [Bradyrhizobium sp. GM22.5]|uniref:hypothetical protein n=1 Tax=Bradyrhizobium sp. CW10 TaxID=2782683 RepID=UPI001FFAA50F|nr:hypothetical protein [Bradyrhizobium sp. CW10]MCK1466611.1 hypothetical protein [Bradyrhizobium sp. CW10]